MMINTFTAALGLLLVTAANAQSELTVRLYSRDPQRDCTGTTTAICTNQAYGQCCSRGLMNKYRTVLCTGLDTTGSPDFCVAFANPQLAGSPCKCQCNAIAGDASACVNCDSAAGLNIKGGSVYTLNMGKRGLLPDGMNEKEAIGCEKQVEPDAAIIDGHKFAISDKHGVPKRFNDMFWDILENDPDIKYADIPEELKGFEDSTIVEDVDVKTKRNVLPTKVYDMLTRRQLPPSC